ncbi:MAG: glycosyltransferase, partial [bacterium]
YLKKTGWEPIILTPRNSVSNFRETDVEPVYNDIKVYYTNILEPKISFRKKTGTTGKMSSASVFLAKDLSLKDKIIRWIRINIFIPDAKILWKFFAVKKGKYVIKKEKPDIILSTSPPPTTSLVARKLAKWSKLKWIADFRDPWTNIYYYEKLNISAFSKKKNKSLEKKVLKDADKIITVSENFFPDFKLKDKIVQIENGFDPDDIENLKFSNIKNEKFTIRYIGSLKINQFFRNFIDILVELDKKEEYNTKIKFETIGYTEPEIQQYIESKLNGIEVNFHGYVTHSEAIEQMATSDLLVMAIGKGEKNKNVISTKIFEYLLVGIPILAFGHQNGIANKILKETKGGKMFGYEEYDKVRSYLLENYNNWKENLQVHKPDQAILKKYNFANLTERLATIMENCISDHLPKNNNETGN